jgi:tripartite-type tricarboxylate transporter receptor subunit TctC
MQWIIRLAIAAIAALSMTGSPMSLAAYPDKPVRIVCPYPAGGGTDILARVLAQKLSEAWGVAVVVDNRPGADTQIGNQAVAIAAPDGYTLLITATTFAMHQYMTPNLPYDPVKDFTPIAPIAVYPYLLVVGNDVPVKTAADLVDLAKKNPGKLNNAISSGGQYVLSEIMKRTAGIDVVGIRYKGGTPAVQAVVTGEVTYHIDTVGSFKAMIDGGKLRVLATTGDRRAPIAPGAPTFAEAGLGGGDITSWIGVSGPKGMPPAMVEQINAAIRTAVDSPDMKTKLDNLVAAPMQMSVREFGDFMRREGERYDKAIKQYNLTY